MRGEIREELRANLASMDIDLKALEDRIHESVHAKLDRERDRLREERDRLREERRALERERKRVRRENNDDDDEWDASWLIALGLYGLAALFLIQRSRKQNNV
jgi:uncharacterized protein YlxW (UPF0749 family)